MRCLQFRLAFACVLTFGACCLAAPGEREAELTKGIAELAEKLITQAGGKDRLSQERVAVMTIGGKIAKRHGKLLALRLANELVASKAFAGVVERERERKYAPATDEPERRLVSRNRAERRRNTNRAAGIGPEGPKRLPSRDRRARPAG